MTLNNCTISGHQQTDEGGGIFAGAFSTNSNLIMSGGTVAGNSARLRGAGIAKTGGALTLTDVVISGNRSYRRAASWAAAASNRPGLTGIAGYH